VPPSGRPRPVAPGKSGYQRSRPRLAAIPLTAHGRRVTRQAIARRTTGLFRVRILRAISIDYPVVAGIRAATPRSPGTILTPRRWLLTSDPSPDRMSTVRTPAHGGCVPHATAAGRLRVRWPSWNDSAGYLARLEQTWPIRADGISRPEPVSSCGNCRPSGCSPGAGPCIRWHGPASPECCHSFRLEFSPLRNYRGSCDPLAEARCDGKKLCASHRNLPYLCHFYRLRCHGQGARHEPHRLAGSP
jgi:hypothetical protein